VMLVLATVAIAAAAFPSRGPGVARTPVASIALVGFVAQEHVERLVHTGELPWLLDDRAFVIGLLVQIPVALACLALARLVVGSGARRRRQPPVIPSFGIALVPIVPRLLCPSPVPARLGRAPPAPSTD